MKRDATLNGTRNQKSNALTYLFSALIGIFLTSFGINAEAQNCCPEFYLQDAVDVCTYEGACMDENPGQQSDLRFVACKNITHTYTVYPRVPGYTYSWSITGGSSSTSVGNPVNITWGPGSTGYIKVVISNLAYGGSCVDSVMHKVCLIDGPQAGFMPNQDTVCENATVNFINTSLGGSVYSWDFGDGNSSSLANPSHSYTSAGTYTVTLTVQDMGPGIPMGGQEPPVEVIVPCGCTDTISKTITVLPGSGPVIETDCCFGTMCPGDTAVFCTPNSCSTYDWMVSGGSIISGQGTTCVTVAWDAIYTQPTSVSLATPGCSTTPCDDTTTLQVPVLYPNLPITGPSLLCQNSSGSFTMPTLPGTYYTWTVSGGNYLFNMQDRNTPTVNITFFDASTYTIKCDYNNPLAGCSGSSTFIVDVRPEFTIFFGLETICEGDTAQYNANGPATWSVSPAGPVVSGPGNSANIIWTSPGIYVITATPLNPANFCNASAVKVVEVVPLPVLDPIAGADSVCTSVNETYSISSDTEGHPFIWSVSGGTGNILLEMGDNNDSVVVQWTGSGPWQLEVYQEKEIAPGQVCESLKKTIDVYPFAAPSISGPTNVCVDAQETYSASVSPSVGNIQWSISPSNRGTIQSGQGTNTVGIRWHGPPTSATLTVATCSGTDQISINISNPPAKPTISANGPLTYCDPNMPNNLTLSVPSGYSSYQWYYNGSISGANSNTYNIPNPTFTGPGAYVFLVKVSNGLCSVTNNVVIVIGDCGGTGTPPLPFDCSIDFTFAPSPACENELVNLVAIPPVSGFTYAWNFGDGSTSFESSTQHAWTTAGTYSITLTATLGNTCVADTTKTITIHPLPSCTLAASDTIICPGDFATLIACDGMTSYRWFKNGAVIANTTTNTLNVTEPGEYHVQVFNSFGCSKNTNTINLYHHKLPEAEISGPAQVCGIPGNFVGVLLETPSDPNYSYSWSSNPAGAIFTQPNSYITSASITTPASLPAVWEFMVDVTDDSTNCVNSDTICVTIFEQPQLALPNLYGCEGDTVTLVPSVTPNDPGRFTYKWSDGYEGMIHDVWRPGFYSLTITDTLSGCSATANAGFIYPKPDVSLFPTGCADLCPPDSMELYLPLPLNSNQWPYSDYNSAYPSIAWYDNGTQIGSGETVNFVAGNTGFHEITAVVQNQYFCVDTAGVFCITDDVCCDIVVDYLHTTDATCPESADGSVSILLSPNSVGGPFTITKIFPPPAQSWPITPGVPFNLGNLPPGTYAFQITSADGACSVTFDLYIDYLQEDCCFAAIDSLFIHITSPVTYSSDMVWDNKYYIADGVMVTVDGAMLDITNVDVVFGECAGIEFINGGYLRANNSVFRPCDIDKSWKGLRFDAPGEFDNIVNESTFKNAEAALYFRETSDAVISNNLFSNCNHGVRVEYNNRFNHPISGNRFVTDDFFPDFACDSAYSFVSNNATYGIRSVSTRFTKQVSHNEFINAKGNELPSTYGIHQRTGGGIYTENTFTDVGLPVYFNGQTSYTSIKNNEIELNQHIYGNFTAIFAVSNQGPVIEILNNEISNNYDQFSVFTAMYLARTDNLSIAGNVIDGFSYGILNSASANYQISNNTITNAGIAGIGVFGIQNSVGYITCNNVTMRNMTNGFGFLGYYLNPPTEISSNCFTDCNVSMSFTGLGGNGTNYPLPLIRNNFLYNYNTAGINVINYSGNIGTMADPGINTLWSNNNSAVDIQSNSTINVADNFGMFNISFPQVQITSNNPYHSTASCGRQIFNMPSQGNLNISYDCDNFDELLKPMAGSGGNYTLQPGYQNALKSMENSYAGAATILASVTTADEMLLEELLNIGNLSANEQTLLQYRYYYGKGEYEQASTFLETYHPTGLEGQHYKALASIDLKVEQAGWNGLSQTEVSTLEEISTNDSPFKNYAISLLNNISGYRDLHYEIPEKPKVTIAPGTQRIGTAYLNIFPNPASQTVVIQLVNDVNSNSTLSIYDMSGKLCTDYEVSFVAGSIELDINRLDEGIYFVTLTNPQTGLVRKGKMVKIGNE